eukprot:jgi/Galph1/5793/GphlegSOOS_G4455.1
MFCLDRLGFLVAIPCRYRFKWKPIKINKYGRRVKLSIQPLWNCVCCIHPDEVYMREAILLAKEAFMEEEVPVGAVLVNDEGSVVARGRNRVEKTQDPTQHAEMECIRVATRALQNWRLLGCVLYTTLEPCPMCLSALQLARISLIVYGAQSTRLGAIKSWYPLVTPIHPFHQITCRGGVLEKECSLLMKQFFSNRRINKSANLSYHI